MQHLDLIIIGQGITGSCLAWWADRFDLKFLLLDENIPQTSSKIAAGMMTPITGKKLVLAQEFLDYWEPSTTFYRELEQLTQTKFLIEQSMLRILANEAEQQIFQVRNSPTYNQYAHAPHTPLIDPHFLTPYGYFEMSRAGRLLTQQFCEITKSYLSQKHVFLDASVSWAEDFLVTHDTVVYKPADISSAAIIFCDGANYQLSPFFPDYILTPSKGEILTLEIPDLTETRIIHQHLWLIPLGDQLFKCGATYEWEDLSTQPTEQAKQQLLSELATWMTAPVKVIDHVAAVRPTPKQFRPYAGWSTLEPKLGMINGLGSKGALIAPSLTKTFLKAWCDSRPYS